MSKPYRACWCRGDPVTGPDGKRRPGKLLGQACPELEKNSRHGKWYARYEAPADPDGKRRQVRIGPFDTKKDARDALTAALGELRTGTAADDRKTTLGEYLARFVEWHQTEWRYWSARPGCRRSRHTGCGMAPRRC